MSLSTKHLFIPPHTPLVYCFFHMAADDEDESAEPRSIVPVMAPGPPPGIEKSTPSPLPAAVPADEGSAVVRSVVRRWRREHLLEKSGLILRALAWIFSLIAVAVLASNRRGGWMSFDHYQEYRYLLAVAVVALVYSTAQVLRQAHRLGTGKDLAPKQYSGIVDFAGDQVIAYLLISASSAAIPITDRMRQEVVNTFTDASVAAISMALLTFAALCLSALISGFLVSKRSYF
ncbi:CASP-like protein 4B2 [Musa acuminata AAA Group]|uniref:CASP-like protein 4B2 n=1 Tax=Musa acuminata AAA Group TaxID=214697 RepID=UPI0031DBB81C